MIRFSGVLGGTSNSRRRETADQMPPDVDHVEIEDHLDVARSLQRRDRLGRRHVLRKRKDFRVHDAAGGLLGILEQLADFAAGGPLLHQLEDLRGDVLGQIADDRRRVVRRELLEQFADFFGRSTRQQRRRAFGSELADRLHREPAIALHQQRKRRESILLRQLREHLRQVGRVLFLEQIDEIRRRADAKQAFDGVQHDIELALRHGSRFSPNVN
jgi:hypothetical protein